MVYEASSLQLGRSATCDRFVAHRVVGGRVAGGRSGAPLFLLVSAVVLLCWVPSAPTLAWQTAADLSEYPTDQVIAWRSGTVDFTIVRREPSGVSETQFVNTIGRAADVWSTQACGPALRQTLGPSAAASGDGVVTVEFLRQRSWSERGYDLEAAATTDVRYAEGPAGQWQIVDADIYINGGFPWGARGDGPDLEATLVHEFGHVLGLTHCCEPGGGDGAPACNATAACGDAAMHPRLSSVEQRRLSPDDVGGLCFLYENPACADGACVSCTQSSDCAETQECVTGSCQAERPRPPPECSTVEDCADGDCVEGRCTTLEIGDPCNRDGECAHGLCSDGACTAMCGAGGACPESHSCAGGICVADLGVFGEACDTPAACSAGVCLDGSRSAPVCSRACDARSVCPARWECTTVTAQQVCTPTQVAGCSAAATAVSHPPFRLGLCLMFGLILMRRRR